MNIFHPLSKFNFLSIWFIEEELVSISTLLLIIIDMIYFYNLFPYIGISEKKALIPYYNWYLVYKKFWNRKAFFEHITIEIAGILLPLFAELIEADGGMLIGLSVLDIGLCFLGIRHHWEINEKLFEHFGADKKQLPLCLFFDSSLFYLLDFLNKKELKKIEQQKNRNRSDQST